MLQQTRVETVERYYTRFLKRFPTVELLAAADLDEVLKQWEGLGYYRRAEYLHTAARDIVTRWGGVLPSETAELSALPGFGPYMVGAVRTIGFQLPGTPLDGNLERVLSRLDRIESRLTSAAGRRRYEAFLLELLPGERIGDFVQALMDLGAGVCIHLPRCGECPLQELCQAHLQGMTEKFPPTRVTLPPREIRRTVLFAVRDGAVLLARRPAGGLLGGLWEFPGVEEIDKSRAQELLRNNYGIDVNLGRRYMRYRHVFSHVVWDNEVRRGEVLSIAETMLVRWVSLVELDSLAIPAAFRPLRDKLPGRPNRRKTRESVL